MKRFLDHQDAWTYSTPRCARSRSSRCHIRRRCCRLGPMWGELDPLVSVSRFLMFSPGPKLLGIHDLVSILGLSQLSYLTCLPLAMPVLPAYTRIPTTRNAYPRRRLLATRPQSRLPPHPPPRQHHHPPTLVQSPGRQRASTRRHRPQDLLLLPATAGYAV